MSDLQVTWYEFHMDFSKEKYIRLNEPYMTYTKKPVGAGPACMMPQ
jgi:hypothetical protein